MKVGFVWWCFLLVGSGVVRAAPAAFEQGGKPAKSEVIVKEAGVRIIPSPNSPCRVGETLVWTAAMQSAFDRVAGAKGPMKLQRVVPDNPCIQSMRKFAWDEETVLPQNGWFAVAGPATPELAAEATRKWRALAGQNEKPFKCGTPAGESGYAAFAGLKREFVFSKEFYPSKQSLLDWGEAKIPIKFFGVAGENAEEFRPHVRVLAYHPDERIQALECGAKEGDDQLVLYMPSGPQAMQEAIQWVAAWRKGWGNAPTAGDQWNDKWLHAMDDLRVPEISLEREDENLTGWFNGDLLFEGQVGPWRITDAKSSAKLEVDAKGVKIKAKASIEERPLGGSPPPPPKPQPRRFWFDRPFFLFLWRENAEWPYAAVWFGNADGLVK
ncbi:MAG: hypothetical protein QM755_14510 [Luteolibacter sp.]